MQMLTPVFAEGRIEIGLLNKILLTRIESNIEDIRHCQSVIVYSHGMLNSFRFIDGDLLFCIHTGFPDSSVVPYPDSSSRECGHFSSRMPRKLCSHFLQTLNSVAFVAFNGRGIPGSSETQPRSDRLLQPHATPFKGTLSPVCRSAHPIEEAPREFFDKTLTQDLADLASVVSCCFSEPRHRASLC